MGTKDQYFAWGLHFIQTGALDNCYTQNKEMECVLHHKDGIQPFMSEVNFYLTPALCFYQQCTRQCVSRYADLQTHLNDSRGV